MKRDKFKAAIEAAIANGDRLWEDSRTMLDYDRPPTAYALAILAQEEYAKAVMLSLVDAGAIPWSGAVRSVLREHVCKQLLSFILDYLCPDTEEFIRRIEEKRLHTYPEVFPADVLDAIHVICCERIPKDKTRWWIGASGIPIDPKVDKIARAFIDRRKQDALYIGIGADGCVVSAPERVTSKEASIELDRAQRIGERIRPYRGEMGRLHGLDWEKLVALFSLLTGTMSPEKYKQFWWV